MKKISEFPDLEISTDARIPLYRRIGESLYQAILSGQLVPGERLPTREALAKKLQTSPVTVGRGYEWLQGRGLVEQKRRSGTWLRLDALTRVEAASPTQADGGISEIVVLIGEPDLTCLKRDMLEALTAILTGVTQEMGDHAVRYRYVASLDRTCLESLGQGNALLVWKMQAVDPTEAFLAPALLHELDQRHIPTLGIWGHGQMPGLPRVDYSPYQAVNLAVQHLLDCGCRRLGYIGGMGQELAPKFFEFTNVLFKAGLDFQFSHVREADLRPGSAYHAVAQIAREDLPDAFFVDADWKAMEVVSALTHAGIRVPEDVGVIGYGDIPDLQGCVPRLTTVRLPRREIGQAVGRQLLAWMRDRTPLHSQMLDAKLVVRDSTASVKASAASKPGLSNTVR